MVGDKKRFPNNILVRLGRKFSLISVIGIVLIAFIIAFLIGVIADNTTWGRGLATKIESYIGNRGAGKTANLPDDLDYGTVEELYDRLRGDYYGDLDQTKLLDGVKKGLASASGDPYTIYLNEDEAKEFGAALNNEFSGVGAEIAIKNDQLQVIAPIEGTPAATVGLRPGDLILSINGEETTGMFIEQAVGKIRGPKGTEVTLVIGREGKVLEVKIVRDKIAVSNAKGEILDGDVGYLKINTFGDKVVDEVKAVVADFKKRQVSSVIVDLRGNSGGLLDASVDVAGLWLDSDVVVEQKGKQPLILRSSGRGALYGLKTIVLINKGSASASEILAGALQDHGAAVIVGETSFGKGSVQSLENLNGGGQLKVTIARWYTPKGRSIDHEGIKPDHEVPLTSDDFNNDRDPQLDKAKELLK